MEDQGGERWMKEDGCETWASSDGGCQRATWPKREDNQREQRLTVNIRVELDRLWRGLLLGLGRHFHLTVLIGGIGMSAAVRIGVAAKARETLCNAGHGWRKTSAVGGDKRESVCVCGSVYG